MPAQPQATQTELPQLTLAVVLVKTSDWFRFFLRKWWIIGLAGIIGAGGGILYATLKKASYESRLTFALEESTSGGLSGALGLASQFGIDLGGGSKSIFAGDNILEILKSRRIIERALLSVDSTRNKPETFANEYLEISNLRKGLEKNERLRNISYPTGMEKSKFSYLQDSILYVIYKKISDDNLVSQKPDRKLNIYEVVFTSPSETFAKLFVDRLIIEARTFYTELRITRSRETLEILEHRVESLKGSLNAAISTRAGTQDANLNPAFAAAQVPLQKKQSEITVYGEAYAELFKNLELARYQYLKDIPLLQVIDAPQYPMKRIKLGRLYTGVLFGLVAGILVVLILSVSRYMHENAGHKDVQPV